jgi:hypothetical protein
MILHPERWLSRAASSVVALSLFSLAAHAGDYYVDAVHGDNANSGASPAQAWRTITRAVSALPSTLGPAEVVHVAPGVYDSALGEVFPLNLMYCPTVQLVGSGGSAFTILDGGGAGTVLNFVRTLHAGYSDPLTLVQGLTLRNAVTGIALYSSYGPSYVTCRDLKFTQLSGWAITAGAGAGNSDGQPIGVFQNVEVSDCGGAVHANAANTTLGHPRVDLTFTDCTLARNANEGILVEGYLEDSSTLAFTRTKVIDNGREGVRMVNTSDGYGVGGTNSIEFTDCLIARNGRTGVKVAFEGGPPALQVDSYIRAAIRRCTIANNAGPGLDVNVSVLGQTHLLASLDCTILFGNSDDVSDLSTQPWIVNPTYNDIGDGDFAWSNGNISSDPLFVDPVNGDFRVRYGSPCIERGDPATVAGTLDLARNARPLDGNLDTVESFDIGAYEMAPLFLDSTGQLGTPLKLECWGKNGAYTMVTFSRLPLVAPVTTAFGELYLNTASVGRFFTSPVASSAPFVFARPIPDNPIFVGRTFSFQGWTLSSAAPVGYAYTNAVSVTIVP